MHLPKWLQGMVAPTAALWLGIIAEIILGAASEGVELPGVVELLSRVVFGLVMASWVTADARKRGERLCQDYDSFVFFAWPIVMPVYLFRTRGAKAFLTLLCFAGICFVVFFAASAVHLVRGMPR